MIDLATRTVTGRVALGNGPDPIALARVGGRLVAVIAIENEPIVVDSDGDQTDDEDPGLPGDVSGPGLLQVVDLADLAAPRVIDVPIDLAGTGLLFPADPQPEFVDVHRATVAVSLQENNGIAIVDLRAALRGRPEGRPAVERIFSTGTATDRPADLLDDDRIAFTDRYPSDVDPSYQPNAGARTPDAIAFSDDGRVLYSADEGEQAFTGGRGWSAWNPHNGRAIWDDARSLERTAVRFGQYPDSRSDAKGIEVESVEVARFGRHDLALVGSERGSFVAVYDISRPRNPRFLSLLPTGVEPEGIEAIPRRGLIAVSNEGTGNITIFARSSAGPGEPGRPQISSRDERVPFSAISGLAGLPGSDDVLIGVPDDALPSALYRIVVRGGEARLSSLPITKDGAQALYDLEGVVRATTIAAPAQLPGFWLAQEGNAAFNRPTYRPNLLIQTDLLGRVLREIPLPPEIDSPTGGRIRSNGFEGVAVSDSGRYLLAAIQRGFASDAVIGGVVHTRIARYDLVTGRWDFFLYPFDENTTDGFIGLSEIVNLGGDRYAVIERDQQVRAATRVKRVYSFTLDGLTPSDGAPIAAGADLSGRVVTKTLVRDVAPDFQPFEKVEGLALTRSGDLWAVLDNDGGLSESRLVRFSGPRPQVDLWLSLLHMNDGESKLLGTPEAGGAARFTSVVFRARGQATRVGGPGARSGTVAVSSGDNLLAGPELNASLSGAGTVYDSIFLNSLALDAFTLGNHELDFGPDVLARVIRDADRTGPWLSANLDVSPEPAPARLARRGRIASSTVVSVRGRRVGIVGATTPELPFISSPREVIVSAVLPAVQAEVDRLTRAGVDIVILSSHLQSIEEDLALAPQLRGVDVMIAGGGSELLANPDDLLIPGDAAQRPYPVLATDADGRRLPIVTTSGDLRYLGRAVLGFDGDGQLIRIGDESGPVRVVGGTAPDAIAPNPTVQQLVTEPVQAAVDALAANRLASTEVRLEGRRNPGIRTQETNLGDLATDALLFAARRQARAFGLPLPTVAIQNGGGIRNNDLFPPIWPPGSPSWTPSACCPSRTSWR